MSASNMPTRRPRRDRVYAILMATVDLPTPPLQLETAITCSTLERALSLETEDHPRIQWLRDTKTSMLFTQGICLMTSSQSWTICRGILELKKSDLMITCASSGCPGMIRSRFKHTRWSFTLTFYCDNFHGIYGNNYTYHLHKSCWYDVGPFCIVSYSP